MESPSQFLSADDIRVIRSGSLTAETEGRLTAAQLALIADRRWYSIMVPAYAGGLELPLPDIMRLLEAAAWADGSFGWALNLGAGANMFAGFLPPETATEIFNRPETSIAGSGALSGNAEKLDGGYRVTGSWKYASGASHADFFSVSCFLRRNGQPITDNRGQPETRSFIIPAHQVTLSGRWNSFGLKATASHDFTIQDVFVPNARSFSLVEPSPYTTGALYRFPFAQLAEAMLAVTISGMAWHFIDLITELSTTKIFADPRRVKDYPALQQIISQAKAALTEARDNLYRSVREAWVRYEKKETADAEALNTISGFARQSALISRTTSEDLYPWAGMDAVVPEGDINRVWRDIHTASQHILLSPFTQRAG